MPENWRKIIPTRHVTTFQDFERRIGSYTGGMHHLLTPPRSILLISAIKLMREASSLSRGFIIIKIRRVNLVVDSRSTQTIRSEWGDRLCEPYIARNRTALFLKPTALEWRCVRNRFTRHWSPFRRPVRHKSNCDTYERR